MDVRSWNVILILLCGLFSSASNADSRNAISSGLALGSVIQTKYTDTDGNPGQINTSISEVSELTYKSDSALKALFTSDNSNHPSTEPIILLVPQALHQDAVALQDRLASMQIRSEIEDVPDSLHDAWIRRENEMAQHFQLEQQSTNRKLLTKEHNSNFKFENIIVKPDRKTRWLASIQTLSTAGIASAAVYVTIGITQWQAISLIMTSTLITAVYKFGSETLDRLFTGAWRQDSTLTKTQTSKSHKRRLVFNLVVTEFARIVSDVTFGTHHVPSFAGQIDIATNTASGAMSGVPLEAAKTKHFADVEKQYAKKWIGFFAFYLSIPYSILNQMNIHLGSVQVSHYITLHGTTGAAVATLLAATYLIKKYPERVNRLATAAENLLDKAIVKYDTLFNKPAKCQDILRSILTSN